MKIDEEKMVNFIDDGNKKAALRFVKELEDRGELFRAGDVDIDMRNIIKRRFACEPLRCINKKNCRKKDDSCCSDHGVMTTPEETKNIMKLMKKYRKEAAEIMPPSFRPEKGFTPDESYEGMSHTIKKNNKGSCYFSFHDPHGRILCVIEHLCRQKKLNSLAYKPVWCYMWPMAFLKYAKDRYLLTVYCMDTKEIFRMTKSEVKFDCVNNPDKQGPRFYEAEKRVIEHVFGKKFYRLIDDEARKISR
ncbi:MAG: DUF3109 family protein [Candidatus Goldiibacteriota bacterium]